MNLEKYKWKSRILLVITPNFKDQSYQKVKKIYQSKIKEFHKRYVKLICKINKKVKFSINLIGFDGKSKKTMDKLNYKIMFKIIDKMPLSKKSRPINLSLYSDYNPKTTTQGLGFKNKEKALYTIKTIKDPTRFLSDDLIKNNSVKQLFYLIVSRLFYFIVPTYIWILEKQATK